MNGPYGRVGVSSLPIFLGGVPCGGWESFMVVNALHRKLKGFSRTVVLAAVVAAPWLFASADPWAYLLVCMTVTAGVAAWLLSFFGDPRPEVRVPALVCALLALLAFLCVQMAPMPNGIVKAVSPISADAEMKRVELFRKIGATEFLASDATLRSSSLRSTRPVDDARPLAISASSAGTRRSLYLLVAYVGVFLVMGNVFAEWSQLRKAANVIAISSFIMVVIALMHKLSGADGILWFYTPRFGGSIFGPFTNRDHFALHMNMAFGLTLGLLLAASRASEIRMLHTWRERIAWLSSGKASQVALLGFAAMLMGAAVCLTLSRGGITSLAASLGIVGTLVGLRSGVPSRGRVIIAVVLLIGSAVVWLGWQPVMERLGSLFDVARDPMKDTRAIAALDTLRMFWAFPVLGCGFGSYQHVFPIFQSPSIQVGRFWHAHNDYAQLLAEGGLVGTLLFGVAVGIFLRTLWKRLPAATTRGGLMAGGLAVGIIAVALHSFVDYGLHKPANGFLFATLCGMSLSAVYLRHSGNHKRTRDSHHHERVRTHQQRVGAIEA